jgi:hypothetical protein
MLIDQFCGGQDYTESKMKKIITILVMLTSIQSQGVQLSEDGTGQVLIFPYYTVNNDFNSLLTITNATERAKALRVRFREAANSREVFTFNLYLGANDVWVAGLIKREGSIVELITPDNSCTVPDLHSQQNFFSKSHFTNDMQDAYGDDNNRLFEGFIEVIEMGELTGNSELAATVVETGIQPPYNCNDLVNAWDANHADNYWIQDTNTDLLPPRGGISGDLTLINVPQGIAMNAKPTVIENFSYEVLHHNIGSDSPSLADGMPNSRVVDNQGHYFDMAWDSGIKAFSSILMVSSFDNEYEVNADFGAQVTWISTFPTKQYFTDPMYTNQAPIAPFTQVLNLQINCENFENPVLYSRESQSHIGGTPPIGGTLTAPPRLCYSTNALSVGDSETNSVFASNYKIENISETFTPQYTSGWMHLSFSQSMTQGNTTLKGLPMIGFSAQTYQNGALANHTLANYGAIAEHNTQLEVDSQETPLADSAMQINDNGTGQVLIYPYYTVRSEINSLLSIVNTSDEVKAVRVKFREGKNARNVLDFNLYLAPYDVWTAQLKAVDSSVNGHVGEPSVLLQTTDTSCLVPNNISLPSGQEFLPFGYEFPYDENGHSLERVQEGFIEVIEMGILTGTDAEDATHIAGIPPSCENLEQNWLGGGKWFTTPNQDIQAPDGSGDLHGSLQLISVADGIDMKYDAVAISGYSTEVQHSTPGTELPNLSSGNNNTTVINQPNNNSLLTTTWDSSLDAVSALFMHDTTSNQYDINPGVGAQTDWIIMSPTRHYYTDSLYGLDNPKSPYSGGVSSNGDICQEFAVKAFDREQKSNAVSNPVPGALPPGNYDEKMCNSINVSFADNTANMQTPTAHSLFDSNLIIEDWMVFNGNTSMYHMLADEGIMQMNLDDGDRLKGNYISANNIQDHTIYGKPIISFTAQKYVNGKLGNGVLANYAIIKADTTTRKIEVVAPAQ